MLRATLKKSSVNFKPDEIIFTHPDNFQRTQCYRCIRDLAPELSEKFPTICELNSYFFELKLISKVSGRFLRSISTSLVNLKKIGQGHIFAQSRESQRAKLAIFETCSDLLNMGRVCSVLMPVVNLQSFKMIGRPEVR